MSAIQFEEKQFSIWTNMYMQGGEFMCMTDILI